MTERWIDRDTYLRLIAVAGDRHDEAEKCAGAGAWIAACAMVGAALESVLLVTAANAEDDLKARGLWPAGDPWRWNLGTLVSLAIAAGWFPIVSPGEHVGFEGKLGDAAHAVRLLRNVVHPGAYVRDVPHEVEIGESAYRTAYGVLGAVYDASLATLREQR
jgi:hypothetical protein